MLDIQFIRENAEVVKTAAKNKKIDPKTVDQVLDLDQKRRKLLVEIEQLRFQKNKLTRDQVKEGKQLKLKLKDLEPLLRSLEAEFTEAMYQLPNLITPDVPMGKDESENVVISQWGEPTKFTFTPKDHMTLGEALDIIDTKKASQVTGARFNYLKGDAALLQFALINHVMAVLTNTTILKQIADKVEPGFSAKPFVPVIPPVMINPLVFDLMARKRPEEERFYIPSDDKFLIGSAEHTLGPLHLNDTIPEKDLPLRYVGYSTSFRREAGSYGKDTKGILRVHQFDKIEMESFTTSENSIKEQNFFVAIQEYLVQSLKIPYQKIMICTGDIGKPDYRQIDLECWIPSQNKYRETHTSDLMTDYQSRRLNTKVQRKGNITEFVHMNDATAFAIGRILIAILENNQQADGSIKIPEVLQPFMGKEIIK